MSRFQAAHVYLEENIKFINDLKLSNLQSLLAEKRKERENLDEQFERVKDSTRAALEDLYTRATAQKATLDKLHNSLAETQKDLMSCHEKCAADSNAFRPSSFVKDIDNLQKELTNIDNAENYVKTLLAASDLRAQAKRAIVENPEEAIRPYNQLVELTIHIKKRIQMQDQYAHLASHLDRVASALYQELLDILTKSFSKTLEELSWPAPLRPPYKLEVKEKLGGFQEACRRLLLLKAPQKFTLEESDAASPTELIPITIMNKALSLRFRYHFETSKPTNRPDKPEWFLSHVKNAIGAHLPFLITTVQPIVTETLQQTVSVKDIFINGLMEDILRKLRHQVPRILKKPSWLSHTIHEVLEFEKTLLEDFSYQPLPACSPANLILANGEWFNAWFYAEKEFAEKRYMELITDGKAFDPYEEQNSNHLKNNNEVQASRSASKLLALLESITESYKLLPRAEQKLRFLLDIQFNLLGQYYGRINGALDSFEALNLIRSVPAPGGLPDAVTGLMTTANSGGTLAALHRLYRWWASSRTVCDTLKELGDEDFFLDMQYQIHQNDELLSRMTSDQNPFSEHTKDTSDNSIFSGALVAFGQLEQRVDKIAIKIVMKEWASDARLYVRRWQMPPDDTSSLDDISAELYQPLQNLRISCDFLSTQMLSADFVKILRELFNGIEDWHMRNIIAPNRLSEEATQQLRKDLELGLWKIGRRWVNKPENFTRRLKAQMSVKENEESMR